MRDGENTFLRDALAIDRTILANERTLLAYLRTTMGLLAAGGSVMHFLEGAWVLPLGLVLLVAGLVLLAVGLRRYVRVKRDLRKTQRGLPKASVTETGAVSARE